MLSTSEFVVGGAVVFTGSSGSSGSMGSVVTSLEVVGVLFEEFGVLVGFGVGCLTH